MTLLDTLKTRPLVFDGATGTHLQTQKLTPDDFGGEHFAGCNELLVVTKQPDGTVKRETVIPVAFVPMTGEIRQRAR